MNQHEKILHYMERHPEGITPMDAFRELHITKLATRVSELIRRGYRIEKKTVCEKHPDGTMVRYMRYRSVPDA